MVTIITAAVSKETLTGTTYHPALVQKYRVMLRNGTGIKVSPKGRRVGELFTTYLSDRKKHPPP